MSEFLMPSLGADMDSGKLTEWMVKPGDKVKKGDIIASVETLKGVIEIEIFENGVIDRLLIQPGTEVEIGKVIALFHNEGETENLNIEANQHNTEIIDQPENEISGNNEPKVKFDLLNTVKATDEQSISSVRPRISPAARHKAHDLGVSYEGLSGTGPRGAITIEDIEKLAEKSVEKTVSPAESMRSAIAAVMSRSKREIPHYYLGHSINITPALEWLKDTNSKLPATERMIYAVLLVKAVARALCKFKDLNGYYKEGKFIPSENINIGVAISLRQGGLVAPALLNTEQKDLTTLMKEFGDLVNRARTGQLRASEMSNGTITVTNLGEQGVESVFPVIYPPQVAMVGFGSVLERPWIVGGGVAPRSVITASLSGDHRVSDGNYGARFLTLVEKLLQKPEEL